MKEIKVKALETNLVLSKELRKYYESKKGFDNIMNEHIKNIIINEGHTMKITRVWEMPNSRTFDIKCISKLIGRYVKYETYAIDGFANDSHTYGTSNDIDPQYKTDYNMDALDFHKMFDDKSVDVVLFDPPYSLRQVSECYKKLDLTVNMETTQSSFWSKNKDQIARIIKPEGYCLSFGWNSNGIGKTRGFRIIEILIVAHGGQHNDTICVVEQKELKLF